jgi:hypothetical protein
LTFCPGFKPVIVAVAVFFLVELFDVAAMTALDGTFAAAATAAFATLAANFAAACALEATAVFAIESVAAATASAA